MRMIIRFSKTGAAKYTSHLDVQRALQRWLSRAGIPVRFSTGFNPHPALSFAAALPLGIESRGEYADTALTSPMNEAGFIRKMNAHAPPGFRVLTALAVEDDFGSLMFLSRFAEYAIALEKPLQEKLLPAAEHIMESKEYFAVRRTKSGEKREDIRPLIAELRPEKSGLFARLAASPAGSLSPYALMEILCREAGESQPQGFDIIKEDMRFEPGAKTVHLEMKKAR
ncbi:MAG: TIGR03936 family radical SAM-associated protein [Bacillota bacterium]|nr:TIGR03936 family radical SAM-associated protein [Bacillota bacterium]